MPNIVAVLKCVFKIAICRSVPSIADPPAAITLSQNDKFGDYQCNSAMSLAGVSFNEVICGQFRVILNTFFYFSAFKSKGSKDFSQRYSHKDCIQPSKMPFN